jgi:hypothetical protein
MNVQRHQIPCLSTLIKKNLAKNDQPDGYLEIDTHSKVTTNVICNPEKINFIVWDTDWYMYVCMYESQKRM